MMDDTTGAPIPLGSMDMACPEGRFMVDVYVTLPAPKDLDVTRLVCDATGTLFRITDGGYVQASPDGEFSANIVKFLKLAAQ